MSNRQSSIALWNDYRGVFAFVLHIWSGHAATWEFPQRPGFGRPTPLFLIRNLEQHLVYLPQQNQSGVLTNGDGAKSQPDNYAANQRIGPFQEGEG